MMCGLGMCGFGMFAMMFWMVLGTVLFIVLATVVIWFLVRGLNRQKSPMMPYTPRQDSYPTYERGYQPPERPETSQEGRRPHDSPKPEYEQPQVQYPQEQEMPPHG
jgi:hypothetical protein